jgi:hypothetical protein
MKRKKSSRVTEYRQRNTDRSRQTGNIDARNNNQDVDGSPGPAANEDANINVDMPGIGDSAWDNNKLTNYTSNHSADA